MSQVLTNPDIGTVVTYYPVNKLPYDVYIIDGCYEDKNGKHINYWTWQKVKSNGKLGKRESGKGNFTLTSYDYRIEIIVKKLK